MSEFLIYIDQNILTHADEAAFSGAFRKIRAANALLAISHVHLIEISRSNDPLRFIPRIRALEPSLLRSKEADNPPSFAREIIVDYDPQRLIEDYLGDFAKILFSIIQAHLPILKMMGGLEDISPTDLLKIYLRNLEGSILPVLTSVTPFERYQLQQQLSSAKEQISREWDTIDFDGARKDFDKIRAKIRADGRLHQVPAQGMVEHVQQIVQDDEPGIFSDFPKGFAQTTEDATTMISSFCMLLNTLGAIPKTGKMLRGTTANQERVLFAQILDNYHIGEAAVANAFLTCDAVAARLASSVFSYAGVGTQVWLMKSPLSDR